jgi:hypothetical protein
MLALHQIIYHDTVMQGNKALIIYHDNVMGKGFTIDSSRKPNHYFHVISVAQCHGPKNQRFPVGFAC